ncbi:hypothetical protein GF343_04755, partial [Candidatus Woesearchaeota archaeon]|nr:hypothetical protein [Candidatus Woesearchaeota archaeon]
MNDFKEAYDTLNVELKFKNYVHTNPVCQVGGQPMYVEDIVKGNIMAKQNAIILGDTGEGKSQIEKDVLAWFGHKGLFLLGRNDMDIREIYRKARFDPQTKQFVTELSEKLGYNITILDEATRCIPMVLNQVFNAMDGYIEIDGDIYKLGDGLSVGLASANLGNGKFLGTSQLDKAFLDRMHFVFDIDNYPRRPRDTLNVLSSTKEPRVKDAAGEDKVELIKKLHEHWKEQETPLVNYIAVCHLYHGLDWLEGGYKNSKKMTKTWPNIQFSEHEKGSDAGLIYPISTRSAIT